MLATVNDSDVGQLNDLNLKTETGPNSEYDPYR